MNEMAFRVKFRIRLRDLEIVFLVRGQILDLGRDDRIRRIGLVDDAVRRLDESVTVLTRIRRERVDQTDVRTFRRFNGTHSAIMRIVNVPDLEARAFSRKTARSQSGQTPLVRQFRQRVVLIHELRQLRGSEELLDRAGQLSRIDQRLRRDAVLVLRIHLLAEGADHPVHAHAVLVLQQFADRTDPSVAQMVDIVIFSDTVLKVQKIADRGDDLFLNDVRRDQVLLTAGEFFLQLVLRQVLVEDLHQDRIIDRFPKAGLFRIERQVFLRVDHPVGKHLDLPAVRVDENVLDAAVLDLFRGVTVRPLAFLRKDLAR